MNWRWLSCGTSATWLCCGMIPRRIFGTKSHSNNADVIAFYERLGFSVDDVVGLGKRL